MMQRVLVIGGYGNFGSHIVKTLATDDDLQLIIAGRSENDARAAAAQYAHVPNPPEYAVLDIQKDFPRRLQNIAPQIVIHTSGPFQEQGYEIAAACIEYGCHYIDLADGRDFVANIRQLNEKAIEKGVTIISGASSVPCLSAAVIDHYSAGFKTITAVDYGISTAQRTNTGLATTRAVLGYVGKPFTTMRNGAVLDIYGWQDLTFRKYPELGRRPLGNCDVPDLALFPARYPALQSIRFRAGLELAFVHIGLWLLSWPVRLGLVKSLEPLSGFLLKASRLFDIFGSDKSAFHMALQGFDQNGRPKTETFYIVAKSGHGRFIPCIPAILCTRLLARGALTSRGAFPCLGIITLDMYLDALKSLDIQWYK